jgi:hypothetical protein
VRAPATMTLRCTHEAAGGPERSALAFATASVEATKDDHGRPSGNPTTSASSTVSRWLRAGRRAARLA